jgi:DNA-directed RNA polymerase specialized sigma24 family protein
MSEAQKHFEAPVDWTTVMRDAYPSACQVIKRLMPYGLRAIYDPEDFVADAIVELMAHPERLSANRSTLLTLVAKRRMIDAARSPRSRFTRLEGDIIDRQPPAVLEQEAAELREMMLGREADSDRRNLVGLRCDGHTLPEIAELTGLGLRTLQRYFKAFAEANEPY